MMSTSPAVSPTATRGTPVLTATGLTKHFPIRGPGNRVVHAVDNVDLELRRGEVVALVGESGSGKSTVARLLAQLLRPTGGTVALEGTPVDAHIGRAFRRYVRSVQMILQDPFASLNPIHRVRYVLTRSIKIHHPGLKAAERATLLAELLTRVDLTPPERYLDKFPHELSGGQRQRVAIARALGANPKVLLADEPVSMLDVSIRIGVLNLLRQLKDRLNLGILYITHDIASARYFADRTVVMYAGQVVERGTSEEVTQQPAHPYTRLLIESAPDADLLGERRRSEAKGEPPSLIRPPTGCRFQPRCPFAMERCASAPPFFAVENDHEAACWLYADDATREREAAFSGGTEVGA
jgi:peptide/nickel transport system ATP-binding protein